MKILKPVVYTASIAILGICLYIFLLGNGVLDGILQHSAMLQDGAADTTRPTFKNDPFSWYFLAKGLFCSLSLYLSVTLIETINGLKTAILQSIKQNNVPQTTTNTPTHTVVPTVTGTEKSWYQARQGVGH